MSKRILITRNGAYGDMLHMSHLPRLLKDNGWDFVGVSTSQKGILILKNNPFVDRFHYINSEIRLDKFYYSSRMNQIKEEYDKEIDLLHSLEVGALFLETNTEYYLHQKHRDKKGKENYYDISTRLAGYPELYGKYRGEMFFDKNEIKVVEHDLLRPGRFKDNFKVMINLSGSGFHKIFTQSEEVVNQIIDKYPNAVVFLTGGPETKKMDFSDGKRIRSIVGIKGFRQASLMMKYMDCAIGCESGIMCISSMWDIPTIQLLTCTDIHNHCKYTTRDYSIQSPARCSPCYKCPHELHGCPKKDRLPICVYFDINKIIDNVDRIYNDHFINGETAKKNPTELPTLQPA